MRKIKSVTITFEELVSWMSKNTISPHFNIDWGFSPKTQLDKLIAVVHPTYNDEDSYKLCVDGTIFVRGSNLIFAWDENVGLDNADQIGFACMRQVKYKK